MIWNLVLYILHQFFLSRVEVVCDQKSREVGGEEERGKKRKKKSKLTSRSKKGRQKHITFINDVSVVCSLGQL